jgi:hypothetical protein
VEQRADDLAIVRLAALVGEWEHGGGVRGGSAAQFRPPPRLKGAAEALEQAEEDSEERRGAEREIKRAPVFLEIGGS